MALQQYNLTNDNLDTVVEKTKEVLLSDGLVVFPTDTVYGLLVNAKSSIAVDKLIAFKDRPAGKPVSVFVNDWQLMDSLVKVPDSVKSRLHALLPGPYTVVLESRKQVDERLESVHGNLGVRYVSYPPVQQLLTSVGIPVTATSANLAGKGPHYSVEAFLRTLSKKKKNAIDLIVSAGSLPRTAPSTVLDFTQSDIKVLRFGEGAFSEGDYVETDGEEETMEYAATLVRTLMREAAGKRILLLLQGDLGAGKTRFVKGIAHELGANEEVISPTFTISYEYMLTQAGEYTTLTHYDLYHVHTADEFPHLGLDSLPEANTVVCVEWGDRLGDAYTSLVADSYTVRVFFTHLSPERRQLFIQRVSR